MSEEETKATVEMCQMLKAENAKLKNHIEMQDITIQKLYAQLNNPQTTIASSGYFQADIPKYTLTYCNTADEENTKLKQEKKELKEWLEEVRNKPAALFPETQEQAEELGKVKFCIEVLERLGE